MEELESSRVYGSTTMRRKRSQTSRRPRLESQQFVEGLDPSPSSSTPPSDDAIKFSSDENAGCDANSRRKELSLSQCVSRVSASGVESEHFSKRSRKDTNSFYRNESGRIANDNKRSSEGVLAPANWRSTSRVSDGMESESSSIDLYGGRYGESSSSGQRGLGVDGFGNDNKVKKVKLKVGGVTRTIQATSPPNGVSRGSSSTKSSQPSDLHRQKQKHNFQENSNGNHSPSGKKSGLHGVPWRDFSRGGFGLEKEESLTGKMSVRSSSGKHGDKPDSLRKSKRASKRRNLVGEFDDDDEDDEIRYLEKLKTSKASAGYREDGEGPSKKQRKLSSIPIMENYGASKPDKDGKKARSEMASDDNDYEEEEESSEGDHEANHKKQRKESIDTLMDSKREMTLTTRQKALQSSKDVSSSTRGSSLVEFPNGLPPAPPRKQKEKLTEVEQQLKKAEAAQRRRMQVEKAARESEAEAIRKILGQDSSRKKREDKIKKRQEEIAQEKAANAQKLLSNTIRWVMNPTGTVVIFPNDMGFPSIFDSKPCSYPPRRENCAGPSCSNPYKYRDSKSKLPLCSLLCYKAIQEQQLMETTC